MTRNSMRKRLRITTFDHVEDNVEADKDDNDDETTQHPFAIEGPPFLGGPEDLSVLSSNATHVAVPLWYNANIVSVFM